MVLLQVILSRELIVLNVFISQCPGGGGGTYYVFSLNTGVGIFLRESLFFMQKVTISHVKIY